MPDLDKLASLYKHWVTADSLNHHLRRSVEVSQEALEDMPKELGQLARQMSVFAVLSVWYSLLYVVVEGYRELGCHDERVNELIAQDEYIEALRRFRNATFHYQEDPISPKLIKFLDAKDSELWIAMLNRALEGFLVRELNIKGALAVLGETPDGEP